MTRQKSEDRVVPKGRRKAVPTHRRNGRGRGKAIPVNEQTGQLVLPFETAEEPATRVAGADAGTANHLRKAAPSAVPKSRSKDQKVTSATMEVVAGRLWEAFQNVAANKGAPGPDRQTIQEVRKNLEVVIRQLAISLLDGSYTPGDIRRVWIPKSGGGQRGLGIPNVVDRVVQEALRLVLEPLYEPTFHMQSHGFRPGRSCHTAIAQARKHLEEGYEWVVDLDLEKFFDRVNHQRLMARLSERVTDRRLLVLIGQMLKAKVVMPDGVKVSTEEGVPQGGPLSPLLSNLVLDELDAELARRGHRFVRYADDCNIYVRSERAGQRVMASVTHFIERRLRLKVNAAKSAVARPEERHFLGFRLRPDSLAHEVEILLSQRSVERLRTKARELTARNWGSSRKAYISRINAYVRGWTNFFGICTNGIRHYLEYTDAHIRRRLRAMQLKHWKTKRTIARRLIAFGANPSATIWRKVYEGRQSLWALSLNPVVQNALTNARLAHWGLLSLKEQWRQVHAKHVVAPRQPRLPGIGEVETRPTAGVTTRRPEEPDVNSTRPVP